MYLARISAVAILTLAATLPQAEAGRYGRHGRHLGQGQPTAAYDADVAAAWGNLLYATLRDEKINPPIASRLIGYFGVTLYESVVPGMPRHWPLGGQLNGLGWTPGWSWNHSAKHYPLAANAALPRLLKGLLPTATPATVAAIDALEAQLAASLRADDAVAAKVALRSEAYGRQVADVILAWAGKDGFATVNAQPYVVPVGDGFWVPTPPANVLNPLLPHWGEMRPFAMATGSEFAPPPPPTYSTDEASFFYAQAKEVYDQFFANTVETKAIANFWADAGPGTGTPPGHWVSILNQIAVNEGLGLDVAAEAYAKLGIAVADAFIACWDAKYTFNLLRPVTYIQAQIDATWLPMLGTPPFPTYTSGHSTQSGASAVVLEDVLGDVAFTDHTHDALGYPARTFTSFEQASEEAAVSRLYGGIHYRFDNDAGLEMGREIGQNVLRSIVWRRGRCGCGGR